MVRAGGRTARQRSLRMLRHLGTGDPHSQAILPSLLSCLLMRCWQARLRAPQDVGLGRRKNFGNRARVQRARAVETDTRSVPAHAVRIRLQEEKRSSKRLPGGNGSRQSKDQKGVTGKKILSEGKKKKMAKEQVLEENPILVERQKPVSMFSSSYSTSSSVSAVSGPAPAPVFSPILQEETREFKPSVWTGQVNHVSRGFLMKNF